MKQMDPATFVYLQTLIAPASGPRPPMIAPSLYTVTLVDGRTFRWTDYQTDLTVAGNLYSAVEPYFKFKGQQSGVGMETATLDIELLTAQSALIGTVPILQAILGGIFDDAFVQRDILLMKFHGDTSLPPTTSFAGTWGEVKNLDGTHVVQTWKGKMAKLSGPFPPYVYGPSCKAQRDPRFPLLLFGPICTLLKSSFAVTGTLTGTPGPRLFTTSLTNPDNWFNQGTILFTSGANVGLEFNVRAFQNLDGETLLFSQMPNIPSVGDAFTAYPGCDRTFSTCTTKFGNGINYFGTDQTPPPATAA